MFNRLVGCVDGVINGELRGWIINLDHPSTLEQVICRDEQGQQIAFTGFTFRQDVAIAMGAAGVFGFAIPLSLLSKLGRVCCVVNRLGATLENGATVALPAASPMDPSPTELKIFLHIPKTAGTSLRNTLLQDVPSGAQLLIYDDTPGISLNKFHQVSLPQRNRLDWVFGHCNFGLDRHVTQPARYVTFVREPLARLRSNFMHHAAAGTQFKIGGYLVRAATVINEGLSEEFDNVMTRVIAGVGRESVAIGRVGEDQVELALANVRKHFCFVGRQDRADADTLALQTHLGVPAVPLSVNNVTPTTLRYDDTELEAVDWSTVAARNRADQLLYSRLEQEGLVSRILDQHST